jgi:hypothetical protein
MYCQLRKATPLFISKSCLTIEVGVSQLLNQPKNHAIKNLTAWRSLLKSHTENQVQQHYNQLEHLTYNLAAQQLNEILVTFDNEQITL